VKGFRLRNIVALFLLVLMGASVLMAHVWKQNAYVRLSKESMKLAREGKALRDSIALLEMEAGDLKKLGRIEGLARERFGLVYGNNPVLVYPEGEDGAEGTLARKGAGTAPAETGKAAWPTRGL
jgi:cell division protein FtsB